MGEPKRTLPKARLTQTVRGLGWGHCSSFELRLPAFPLNAPGQLKRLRVEGSDPLLPHPCSVDCAPGGSQNEWCPSLCSALVGGGGGDGSLYPLLACAPGHNLVLCLLQPEESSLRKAKQVIQDCHSFCAKPSRNTQSRGPLSSGPLLCWGSSTDGIVAVKIWP